MRQLSLLLVLVFFLYTSSSALFAQRESNVIVRIFETSRPHAIDILPPFQLLGLGSASILHQPVTATLENGRIWLKPKVSKDYKIPEYSQMQVFAALPQFSIQEVNSQGVSFVDLADTHRTRKYHGIITLSLLKDGTIDVINKVSRREYVTDVVAAAFTGKAPYEMMRAQAVLVQTLMDRKRQNTLISGLTQSHYYYGMDLENSTVKTAVSSVWGEELYYKNLPANICYHSTCAGGTSSGAKFFHEKNADLSYLAEIPCKHCIESPFWKPTIKEIPAPLFAKIFGTGLPEIIDKDYTDRPLSVKLSNGKIITGYDFWFQLGQRFGTDKAAGTRISLAVGENGNIVVKSTGAGHGVGLCQYGAAALAKEGKSYKEILRYYFPGCVVR